MESAYQLRLGNCTQQSNEVLQSSPSGTLCYDNAEKMLDSVRGLLADRPKEVVLELADVSLMDSSGMRCLLQCVKLCKESGTTLRISSASDAVARVISLSGLEDVFGLPKLLVSAKHTHVPVHPDLDNVNWAMYEYVATSDAFVISDLREQVSKAALEAGACGDALCDIQIAVGEALTNAYKHGSPEKGTNKIFLRCMTCHKAVVVEVEDEGEPFNPADTCEPDPDEMRENGMGIFLMRQAMDVVEFHTDCPGNKVRMVKWLKEKEPLIPDVV